MPRLSSTGVGDFRRGARILARMSVSALRFVSLVAVLFLGCGGASGGSAPPPGGGTTSGGSSASGNNANGGADPLPIASAPSGSRAPIPLLPGFAPAPTVARGIAGGPVEAGSYYEYCIGSMPRTPQHTLRIGAPMYLIVGAYGDVDLTLAVHLPDGSWLCNDDWDGLMPRIEGSVGPGVVEVFVGTYSSSTQGSATNYVVGFSEDPSFMPSSLPWP